MTELLNNLEKIHTTELGLIRIKKNTNLNVDNIIEWVKNKIKYSKITITQEGKNWYINIDNYIFTINKSTYRIITAHKIT